MRSARILRRAKQPDALGAMRRRSSMALDQRVATARHRMNPPTAVVWDGDPRIALITVNFSTTRFLKLMLLTLAEQRALPGLLHRIIVVDNGSRDGGADFVGDLHSNLPLVEGVLRNRRLHHGPGVRAGIRRLDKVEAEDPHASNVLLFCDADVIFRSPDTLSIIANEFREGEVGIVGEPRRPSGPSPDIQASFLAVRRDIYAQKSVTPVVHSGAPTLTLQASIVALGYDVAPIATNHGGLILHRGRAGVHAASQHHPRHQYARAIRRDAHFMGVPDGKSIWQETEDRFDHLLDHAHADKLLVHLAQKLPPV